MNVWITNVSTSKFAGVNTLWAAIMREDFIPDRVHLIADEMVKEKGYLAAALKGYQCVLNRYGNEEEPIVHDVVETEFADLAKKLESIVHEEKTKGHTVAIDMTPGRKYMSAFAMYMGVGADVKHRADRIYYLHVKGLKNHTGQPYPMVPSNLMTLYDLKKEILGE